jgi:hypothetical protein
MKPRLWSLLVFIVLVAFPYSALANAGTPLMWAGMLHLVFGNALIGVFEGLLIARLFSLPKRKTVLVMIGANYFSAWAGGVFLNGKIADWLHPDINNGWRWFWIMVALTYLLTLLLEWPFVAFCFRRAENWLPKSIRANVLAQSASYALLFGWYWMASGTSLLTKLQVTSPTELALPQGVVVYFISTADGNAYRRPLVGGTETKVCELHSTNTDDRLFVRPSQQDKSRWDLVARLETGDSRNPTFVEVLTNLVVEAALDHRATYTSPPQYEGTWFNFGEASPLGSATNGEWKFWAGFWPIEGLGVENKATHTRMHYSYETPFGAWTVRNAVQLPSNKLVFQLGHDQICAFDPQSRKVALLWHGRGPVPVMDKTESVLPDKGQQSQNR